MRMRSTVAPTVGTSARSDLPEARADEENKERRADLLAEKGRACSTKVGLAEVKRAVAEIEDRSRCGRCVWLTVCR